MKYVTAETFGVESWQDLTAEHLKEYRELTGWTWTEYQDIMGVNRGYLWAIVNNRYPMSNRMKKRLWLVLQEPTEALPHYLARIAVRISPHTFERYGRVHAVPWKKIRGAKILECAGCGAKFVGFRSNTKYHSRNCGKRHRRRMKKERRELHAQGVSATSTGTATDG